MISIETNDEMRKSILSYENTSVAERIELEFRDMKNHIFLPHRSMMVL